MYGRTEVDRDVVGKIYGIWCRRNDWGLRCLLDFRVRNSVGGVQVTPKWRSRHWNPFSERERIMSQRNGHFASTSNEYSHKYTPSFLYCLTRIVVQIFHPSLGDYYLLSTVVVLGGVTGIDVRFTWLERSFRHYPCLRRQNNRTKFESPV